MTTPKELHAHFRHLGTDYALNFVKGEKSKYCIQMNGTSYAVLGDEEKLKRACEILESVSLETISSSEDLQGRLSLLKDVSFPKAQKTGDVGVKTLGTKHEMRGWRKSDEENLPKIRKFLAETFWDMRKETDRVKGIKEFLGAATFDQAVKSDDFELFSSLFKDLSADEVWAIRTNENCHPLGFVKTEPYEITEEDRQNIKNYLDDIGFSGAVTLSDARGTYTITPSNQEALEKVSYSMHSVSKIFTGVLALMTMSPDDFGDKLKLPPAVLAFLEKEKKELHAHLEKPTLLQSMSHNGGFGDYLPQYEAAVEAAIKKEEAPPKIDLPEDFLKYAETTTYPLDKSRYSNLGILLVGLAIQHKNKEPFDRLLQELILTPAGMSVSKSKPKNGKFSKSDPYKGMLIGGPSGGYWTTSSELIKLGIWLKDKCRPSEQGAKSQFLSKMELYGNEFYIPEDEEIHHNGNSTSGSSCLSLFLKSGVSIAVLSDQSNFMADRIHYKIREKLIEKTE